MEVERIALQWENIMASTPEHRLELDIPVVVVDNRYRLVTEQGREVPDLLGHFFSTGEVISIHIIVENTGQPRRGFCDFINPNSNYKHKCELVLSADGYCKDTESHQAEVERFQARISESISEDIT